MLLGQTSSRLFSVTFAVNGCTGVRTHWIMTLHLSTRLKRCKNRANLINLKNIVNSTALRHVVCLAELLISLFSIDWKVNIFFWVGMVGFTTIILGQKWWPPLARGVRPAVTTISQKGKSPKIDHSFAMMNLAASNVSTTSPAIELFFYALVFAKLKNRQEAATWKMFLCLQQLKIYKKQKHRECFCVCNS